MGTGRWDEAVTHARVHNGIGAHLMEGRQAEIISYCLRGARQLARTALEECELTEPWERQVGACLSVMCSNGTGVSAGQNITAMVGQFLRTKAMPGYAVFRARFGLTTVTLLGATDPATATQLLTQVAAEVISSGDGYAARDVLDHHSTVTGQTGEQHEALAKLVASAGLGAGDLPKTLLDSLTTSAKVAREILAKSLGKFL